MLNKLFSTEDTDIYLLNQSDFKSDYQLVTETVYVMGEENPPMKIKNTTEIELIQTVVPNKKKIQTSVGIKNVVNETDNPVLRDGLKESELFIEIISLVTIERNLRGEYIKIANLDEIENNWIKWKKQTLPTLIPDLSKQKKVISNFQNGLKNLNKQFNNNLQYILLLPECYKYRDYFNPKDMGSIKEYLSRLVENLEIGYRLKKDSFKIDGNKVELVLKSTLLESQQKIIEDILISFYEKYLPDFSYKQYKFNISITYLFEKETSNILSAQMFFREELHPNLHYSIHFDLTPVNSIIE